MPPARRCAGASMRSRRTRSCGSAKLRPAAKRTGNGWWNFAQRVSHNENAARILMTHYHVFETTLGFAAIAWNDAGVTRFNLPGPKETATNRLGAATPATPPPHIAAIVDQARRYFDGEQVDFGSIGLDLSSVDPLRRS